MTTNLIELTATDAIAAMRHGDLRAEDYAVALLNRCEQCKHLNAFITIDPERVLASAREADRFRDSGAALGPLHGLPIPVKDSVNTKAYPTTGGTYALRNFIPDEDAGLVRELVDAGAIVLGKTNIHELSFGWTSNNLTFGTVHNPYDISRIPGGSSGGTAAAIAAGMSPLGIAEDTQGSIRVPAALCGIYGFRPTTGRYPADGVIPITPLFDQPGPHARTVIDLILFDDVMTKNETPLTPMSLEGVRLGVSRSYYFHALDSEVARITSEVLEKLSDAGAVLVEADVPDLEKLLRATTMPIELYHVVPMLKAYLEQYGTGVSFDEMMDQAGADIQTAFSKLIAVGSDEAVAEAKFQAACDVHLPALKQTFKAYFQSDSLAAMIFPTTRTTAPPIGEDTEILIDGKRVRFDDAIAGNISPGSTAGLPGLVLPTGLADNGLPVSIEVDGAAAADREVLRLGLAIENAIGRIPAPTI